MRWLVLAAAVLVGCAGGPGSGAGIPEEPVGRAMAAARASGRPVLAVIYEPGEPARRLFRDTLESPKVARLLEQFEVADVDLDRWPSERRWRKTGNLPELRAMDGDGADLGSMGGVRPPDEVAGLLTQVLRMSR